MARDVQPLRKPGTILTTMGAEDTPRPIAAGLGAIAPAPTSDALARAVGTLIGTYGNLQREGVQRVLELLEFANDLVERNPPSITPETEKDKARRDAYFQEMLRASVVLTHAHLEDYLRTLAETLLPEADEDTLNAVPLVGLPGRAEKFPLGKLVRHKGKTVDDVLRESVREHLANRTFNNRGEIERLLEALGLDASESQKALYSIQEMIQRRHQIVHRGDKLKPTPSAAPVLQPMKLVDATRWLRATFEFMDNLNAPLAKKLARIETSKIRGDTKK